MASAAKKLYTPEEFLALERAAEYKSEYIDGQIYAMAGASYNHNTITVNMVIELGSQLRGRPCRVFSSDMRVKVNCTTYTYPDIAILCGEPQLDDGNLDALTNPTIIIEVLSSSTEAYDRGTKFERYRKLPSLTEYVLVAQNRVWVEHYTRHSDVPRQWTLEEMSELDDKLQLSSVACEVTLEAIYRGANFSEEDISARTL